ncbi:MAG: lipoyl(octanoyl) transferase LipB [Ferroplasma sp.]|uniref:lipoyl(octanoyl) transferase LipB n=1 Tax=Ferroplasma sp. TaxID=2591003 RepID=UPI00281544BA|nr:lipoyl(octanoyl) transferase LipB [Ferroplasma sp.]WMT51907.1 MAG: lipoyl(octanoyl) transferase LipB [Ferroplasma sp.]
MEQDFNKCSMIYDLGIVDYLKALDLQKKIHDKVNKEESGDAFIFLQHPDVYTAGSHFRGDTGGAIKINRGGYLTYHGPGQLVVYYIINLKRSNLDALKLIRLIQDSVIELLGYYGISGRAELKEKTGVWVGDKKICSIGLGIDKFSTMHGMGLNISTDLKKFNIINPCNFSPEIMTSMDALQNKSYSFNDVKEKFIEITLRKFKITDYKTYRNIT